MLMSLGEAEAAEVFKHLSPKEVQKLGEAIARTKAISRERVDNVVAIAAGDYHSLALKSDGTVVGWGYNVNNQTTVPAGLSNVVAIAAEHRSQNRMKMPEPLTGVYRQ